MELRSEKKEVLVSNSTSVSYLYYALAHYLISSFKKERNLIPKEVFRSYMTVKVVLETGIVDGCGSHRSYRRYLDFLL